MLLDLGYNPVCVSRNLRVIETNVGDVHDGAKCFWSKIPMLSDIGHNMTANLWHLIPEPIRWAFITVHFSRSAIKACSVDRPWKLNWKKKNYLCTSIHLWTASFWPIRIQRPELLSWYMRGPPESPAHGSWYSPSGPFLSSVPNIMKCWKFFMETLRLTLFSWELCCAVHFWLLSSIMNLQHIKQSDQSSTNIKKNYPPYLLWSQW